MVNLHDTCQSSLYYRGFSELPTTALLREKLREGDCFIDLGANVGYYTFIAACLVGPTGRVHAVEPSSRLGDRITTATCRNGLGHRIRLHRAAVADYEGDAFLQRGSHDPTPEADQFISRELLAPEGERVTVTTLDVLLSEVPRVDVIKMDIEGSEVAAIRGASSLLRRCRPRLILSEVDEELLRRSGSSSLELFALLEQYGYVGERYDSPHEAPMAAFRLR
jgi:FkbM family methyltransferase